MYRTRFTLGFLHWRVGQSVMVDLIMWRSKWCKSTCIIGWLAHTQWGLRLSFTQNKPVTKGNPRNWDLYISNVFHMMWRNGGDLKLGNTLNLPMGYMIQNWWVARTSLKSQVSHSWGYISEKTRYKSKVITWQTKVVIWLHHDSFTYTGGWVTVRARLVATQCNEQMRRERGTYLGCSSKSRTCQWRSSGQAWKERSVETRCKMGKAVHHFAKALTPRAPF